MTREIGELRLRGREEIARQQTPVSFQQVVQMRPALLIAPNSPAERSVGSILDGPHLTSRLKGVLWDIYSIPTRPAFSGASFICDGILDT